MRQINQAGLELIKSSEGLRLHAYPDPASGGSPYTCGYGSTGDDIGPTTTWTLEEAESRLQSSLERYEAGVDSLVKVPINDNQFSALVCLSYNIGLGNFGSSTLLKLCNSEDFEEAANQFLVWDKAAGKVMPGLVIRRANEKALFLS